MASEILNLHPETPELRKIDKVVEALLNGAVALYPTDTGFSLGCSLGNKEGISRIRRIRNLPDTTFLTFLCASLSNISEFASVNNKAYRTIKALIPGPFTFILPASKNVPRYAQNPKRKTAGIRVPDHVLSQLLLMKLGSPIIAISAKISDEDIVHDPEDIIKEFAPQVDIAVRSEKYFFTGESTILDMTSDNYNVMRHGAGITKVLEFVDFDED